MKLTDNQLKILLLGSNLIPYEKIEAAMKGAEEKKISLLDYLPSTSLVSPSQLGRLVADALKISFADLREEKIDPKLIKIIPEEYARKKGVIVFSETDEFVKVGMVDPDDMEVRHYIEKKVGKKIVVFFTNKVDLEFAFTKYGDNAQKKLKEILAELKAKKYSISERDKTTVKIVDMIMQYGYNSKASDIHIDPYEKEVVIRFRIDGILHDTVTMPKEVLEFIASRIKILSKMRTDEHKTAQDGKFRLKTGYEDVDIRVSIVPVSEGEKIVMRILSSKNSQYGLTDLGLSDKNFNIVMEAIKNPHGMILVTGPTGSGKTTSVYGVLKLLNKREVNIASIEDPVEYNVEGVNQIQVNNKTNLTFAAGLRSILRQDPDIIMVGEIRDEETASIAINSALTGHLVLSTLHTNDAATTLPRFLEMGIEPFLVASTVNIIIAQRLVRKICTKCLSSYIITSDEVRIIEKEEYLQKLLKDSGVKDFRKMRLYKGLGCKVCSGTGYSGRLGIFEILEMNDNIKDLILKRSNSFHIVEAAQDNGMSLMIEDGLEKIFMGTTTLTEVIRVISV